MEDKEIGSMIKNLRRHANKMTQKELATKIGKNVETVKKYESGKIRIPLNVLHEIARALNVNVVDIICSSEEEGGDYFWNNVIFTRNELHISQSEMSNKLNIGLEEYIKYETDQIKPDYDLLMQISEILSLPPLVLINTKNMAQESEAFKDYKYNENSIFRNNTQLLSYVLLNLGINQHVRTSVIERISNSSEFKEFIEYLIYKYDKQLLQERNEGE